jgi:hypothetical protein
MGFLSQSVVELEYVMVEAISHEAPSIGAKREQAEFLDSRVFRVSIDESYLVSLHTAITGVVGRYARGAISSVDDAGVLQSGVFLGLEIYVRTSQRLLKEFLELEPLAHGTPPLSSR